MTEWMSVKESPVERVCYNNNNDDNDGDETKHGLAIHSSRITPSNDDFWQLLKALFHAVAVLCKRYK